MYVPPPRGVSIDQDWASWRGGAWRGVRDLDTAEDTDWSSANQGLIVGAPALCIACISLAGVFPFRTYRTYRTYRKARAMADEAPKELSEEEERMRLLEMIKNSANGPEQAKRRIEELDKMVQGLKKKRRLCGEQMESDTKRLYWLQKEIDDVEKMRNKLKATADDRIQRADNCAAALDKIQNAMLNIIGSTDSTRSNVTHSVQKIFSNSTTQNLKASRGFSMEPGSTFYQGGRKPPAKGSYAKRMARSHAKLGGSMSSTGGHAKKK